MESDSICVDALRLRSLQWRSLEQKLRRGQEFREVLMSIGRQIRLTSLASCAGW